MTKTHLGNEMSFRSFASKKNRNPSLGWTGWETQFSGDGSLDLIKYPFQDKGIQAGRLHER